MTLRIITAAVLALAAGSAYADQMKVLDRQQFTAFDAQVKADFQDGIKYKEISAADQSKVLGTLTSMETLWQHADANGQLNVSDSIAMANDQSIVATLLHHAAADSRLVCRREVPMGTKIAVNVCRTIAQIKREQDSAQDELRDMQKQPINLQPSMGGH